VHRRGPTDVLGMEERQLGGVRPEHVGQHVREVLQQMEAVGYLAGRGRPKACGFCIRLSPIPYEHLDPGVCPQPLCDGAGLSIGE
jgi:hypothetical protein